MDTRALIPGDDWPVEAVLAVSQLEERLANREQFFEHAIGSWKQEVADLEATLKLERRELDAVRVELKSARKELVLLREMLEE